MESPVKLPKELQANLHCTTKCDPAAQKPSSVIPVGIKSLIKVAFPVLENYDVRFDLISAWQVRVCKISEHYFPNFSRSPEAKWRYGRTSRHNWSVSSAEYLVKLGNKAM